MAWSFEREQQQTREVEPSTTALQLYCRTQSGNCKWKCRCFVSLCNRHNEHVCCRRGRVECEWMKMVVCMNVWALFLLSSLAQGNCRQYIGLVITIDNFICLSIQNYHLIGHFINQSYYLCDSNTSNSIKGAVCSIVTEWFKSWFFVLSSMLNYFHTTLTSYLHWEQCCSPSHPTNANVTSSRYLLCKPF